MAVEITYDLIQPLIVSSEVVGSTVECKFALHGSSEVFDAKATIRRSRDVGSRVGQQVKRQAAMEVRRSLFRMVSSIFGGGFVGRTARSTVNVAASDATRSVTQAPSKKDKEAAIVEAFKGVSSNFYYDESAGDWKKPSGVNLEDNDRKNKALSPFAKQLKDNPVSSKFEKSVLARLLAHLAFADGDLAEEEQDFFSSSIPEEFGSVEELAKKDPVSGVEAEEVPEGVRGTIFMLACAISSIDMDTSPEEVEQLSNYGAKFSLSAEKQDELSKAAKFHVLEGYLHADISRDELFDLGGKLGLSNDDAERAKIQWMKRQ